MRFIKTLVVVALMTGGLHLGFPLCAAELNLHAQEYGMEYTTELQTNFRESNFVNLLRLNAEVPIGKSVTIDASTISIAKTREERLVDDLQTFSNIEEDNLPLAIAVCGVNWQINDNHSLFMGIRNMNEDYFTSPVTSFFVNSSCGVYPTISSNYDIANYPLASVGMHYRYEGVINSCNSVVVQSSLYNGSGNNRFTGCGNIFRFCPEADGIFSLTEAQFNRKGNSYFLGNALHLGENVGVVPWFYVEQRLGQRLTLLAGYSHAFGHDIECRDFAGVGLHSQHRKLALGLFADYARFVSAEEFAAEVACKITISPNLYVQPVCHFIYTHHSVPDHSATFTPISIIRLGVSL